MSSYVNKNPGAAFIPDDVVFGYLDGVGNHEVKNLLGGLFLVDPNRLYTAPAMAHELNGRQGEDRAWGIKSDSVTQYCERSLEPVGAVVSGTVEEAGKNKVAWQANSAHLKGKLALTGLLGEWSLTWPDLSLQQVLGTTTSPTEVRSPKARYGIYSTLLAHEGDTSIIDIVSELGHNYTSHGDTAINGQLNGLVALGIVSKSTNRRGYDPKVRINSVEFAHSAMTLAEAIPETKALYKAIGKLGAGSTITLNSLIDAALEADKEIDDIKLRWLLRQGVTEGRAYPGLSLVEPMSASLNTQSRINLTEQAQEPINGLVEGIDLIKDGQGIDEFVARAKEILSTPADFRTLVAKARHFSPRANASGRITDGQQLSSIVLDLENVTAEQARQELMKRFGRKLSKPTVRTILNDMAEAGHLLREQTTTDPHSGISTNLYRAPGIKS